MCTCTQREISYGLKKTRGKKETTQFARGKREFRKTKRRRRNTRRSLSSLANIEELNAKLINAQDRLESKTNDKDLRTEDHEDHELLKTSVDKMQKMMKETEA